MKSEISSVHEAHALKLKSHEHAEIRDNNVCLCHSRCPVICHKILFRFAFRSQAQLRSEDWDSLKCYNCIMNCVKTYIIQFALGR